MQKMPARNFLIGAGAYYVSMWIAPAVIMASAPITNGVTFSGDFGYVVLMPVVLGIPLMLVAAGTGAATAWLAESVRTWRWAVLPALLYASVSYIGNDWVKEPQAVDRVAQAVRAVLPAAACLAGAITVEKSGRRANAA